MRMEHLIDKKRDGGVLTREEINYFIQGVVDGSIPDYQTSALMMAMMFYPPNHSETLALTEAMTHSGKIFDLSGIPGIKVDKHSTGGVADTTTLVVAPLVAACGVPVVKMSGRGLGFTGGTLDKLESIPGLSVSLTKEQALEQAARIGIVIMGQTEDLDPADRKLYALRDVTGTIRHLSLITSSILSKKIAAGADAIVLDVKCGSGAFMQTQEEARALAEEMVSIGHDAGKKVTALITAMDQPLGQYIGNALEVEEAVLCLQNKACGPLTELALTLGSHMLYLAERVSTLSEGRAMLEEVLQNGKGFEKLVELVKAQGGDPSVLTDLSRLPHSACSRTFTAPQAGFNSRMDCAGLGEAAQVTGAGRATKEDTIDPGAGIILHVRLGDPIAAGQALATAYAATEEQLDTSEALFFKALQFGSQPEPALPLVLSTLSSEVIPS